MKVSAVQLWRNQKEAAALIGQTGTIRQWTMIRVAPKSFVKEAPYPVVIVQIGQTQKIGQLVDWEERDLIAGRVVVAVLRRNHPESKESIIEYTIKFKPYEDS